MTTPPNASGADGARVPRVQNSAPQSPGADLQLRELARQIMNATKLPEDPATTKKGIVSSVVDGSPPTLTITMSGDTTTTVSGVRFLDSYSPLAGDYVLLVKVRAEILAIGRVAGTSDGWTQPSLESGFTHGTAPVKYRRVWDRGSWKMQWLGWANVSSTAKLVISSLGTSVRPSGNRDIAIARENADGPAAAVLRFETDGDVRLDGVDNTINNTGFAGGSDTGFAGDAHVHSHGGQVSQTSFAETHSHSQSSHSHSRYFTMPDWISFDGVEYFL